MKKSFPGQLVVTYIKYTSIKCNSGFKQTTKDIIQTSEQSWGVHYFCKTVSYDNYISF